jgi:hypothetical protein
MVDSSFVFNTMAAMGFQGEIVSMIKILFKDAVLVLKSMVHSQNHL